MLCQRALWIERGQVVMQGAAAEVVAAYRAAL
jgi:ABC-type polysaccharide/polyol phosphate transport system ATPase subunit